MPDPKLSALTTGGKFAGTDQGIDITGGPFGVRAIGSGVVTRLLRSGSGWPGEGALLVYQITEDSPLKGRYVFVAED